ncbi:hypothetical protein CKM354_000212100 [Cercospora kikuchii]|uniref:Fumarylacetoacetate hydrolase n=1 Tax=Cercospora kikuchii TaxID=84275 RepID=A0A9P3FDM8_9PEZI|nr:uncharacterized protein CKM354_000212100 [Cercospora kikuchii]GIZ38715.1 hypothetical protein CKM354_000212100 [Cercospora kikuchii]
MSSKQYQFCAYIDPALGVERIGSLNGDQIQPLAYPSGTPLSNLYEVISLDESTIIPFSEPVSRNAVQLLAPINGRDILCVGKNYAEHAIEFNKSGFDSSDKVDQPTHPVIFTKRFTSIIADGEEILPHPDFTQSADFEGELGVIIGKPGFQISEQDAMNYVWGYTIVNDMTARERQRDHKQFYIGKSPDTYCPMGPVAIPANRFTGALRVQTRVNGDLRQNATTDNLIFSIPYLIKTMSEGQTLMPGDVLATGTPAGVGIGRTPPVYLAPGDEIAVSIEGLGTLTNKIASESTANPTLQRVQQNQLKALPVANAGKCLNANVGLTNIGGKPLNVLRRGAENGPPAVFVHGLGGTSDYWTPLIQASGLDKSHALHLFDFEGHGQSPTSPLSTITIGSLAADLKSVFQNAGIVSGSDATLFAHSMGCIVAIRFILDNPQLVKKLVLVGPPPIPLPEAASKNNKARATLVRQKTMAGVVDAVVGAGTSAKTQSENGLAISAVRMSLLAQDPEGYAKACDALAGATESLDLSAISADTLIVTGSEDKVSPPALCQGYSEKLKNSKGVVVLQDVGHWHVFEDAQGVANSLKAFS